MASSYKTVVVVVGGRRVPSWHESEQTLGRPIYNGFIFGYVIGYNKACCNLDQPRLPIKPQWVSYDTACEYCFNRAICSVVCLKAF